jgi:hypothetical protein
MPKFKITIETNEGERQSHEFDAESLEAAIRFMGTARVNALTSTPGIARVVSIEPADGNNDSLSQVVSID